MEFTEDVVVESQDAILDTALDFLAALVGAMDLAADIAITSETEEQITIRIDSDEDAGVLIGRKGQTLQAIQYLLNVLYGTRLDRRISVDVGDYRARHEEKLLEDAHHAASRVQESGKRFALEPMNPADRRTVHHLVSEQYPDLQTYSTGEEPNRRIVIEPRGATGPRPGEIGRWGGGRARDPRNFDGRRGGTYHSRRPR
ncbi:MAG: R3H domain-containing nucleic acid-binding protein [Candidatus Sericytochromatia bacterium]|nr:R3H domain-containing nucleic acid-binding protein [Candidatus Sericytochromatia bacterium]